MTDSNLRLLTTALFIILVWNNYCYYCEISFHVIMFQVQNAGRLLYVFINVQPLSRVSLIW